MDHVSCTKCLLHNGIPGVSLNNQGVCTDCTDYQPFSPLPEKKLLKWLKAARRKARPYDALVPLSGGKDSAFVLYLAIKKYDLKVLTYTFDNGFMSDMAKENIERMVTSCQVDHIWFRQDPAFLHRLYRAALIHSAEICGICGLGIERSMLKISEAFRIPLILLGHSPTEQSSFTSENLYDQARLKAILSTDPSIGKEQLHRFFIYKNLNYLNTWIWTKLGRFGRKVNILWYQDLPSDKEIGNIIKENIGWKDAPHSEYTRHFDCVAEPFTNFIREKRLGISRRLPQLSTMVRSGELTREEALNILKQDSMVNPDIQFEMVKEVLQITDFDIRKIISIPENVFSNHRSVANRFFAFIRSLVKE